MNPMEKMPEFNQLLVVASGFQPGSYNMAMDDALLDWVAEQHAGLLVLHTYGWREPTLSLGVHQPLKDYKPLLNELHEAHPVVKRPTGGRAIHHGEDISFAWVTNEPTLLGQSISQSYCFFLKWIREAVERAGMNVVPCEDGSDSAYTRSAVCFETALPSDLQDKAGKKRVGCAQLRRKGGLLQHGSAFFDRCDLDQYIRFHQALTEVVTEWVDQSVAQDMGQSVAEQAIATPTPQWEPIDEMNPVAVWVKRRKIDYEQAEAGIRAKV